jgi:hypothetical protein
MNQGKTMRKPLFFLATRAVTAFPGLTAAPLQAAELPDMQVGSRIVSSDAAATSADVADDSAAEPDEPQTDESTT